MKLDAGDPLRILLTPETEDERKALQFFIDGVSVAYWNEEEDAVIINSYTDADPEGLPEDFGKQTIPAVALAER